MGKRSPFGNKEGPVGFAESLLPSNAGAVVKGDTELGVGDVPFEFGVDEVVELLVQVQIPAKQSA